MGFVLSRLMVIAVSANFLTVGYASLQEAFVRYEAGFYTYPEIAAKLSSEAHRVRVAPALSQRVAFLSLQPQPLSKVKQVLASALGVRFRLVQSKDGNEQWLMDAEPKRTEEERALWNALVGFCYRTLQSQAEEQQKFYAALFEDIGWEAVQISLEPLAKGWSSLHQLEIRQKSLSEPNLPLLLSQLNPPAGWFDTPLGRRVRQLAQQPQLQPPEFMGLNKFGVGDDQLGEEWERLTSQEREMLYTMMLAHPDLVAERWLMSRIPLQKLLTSTVVAKALEEGDAQASIDWWLPSNESAPYDVERVTLILRAECRHFGLMLELYVKLHAEGRADSIGAGLGLSLSWNDWEERILGDGFRKRVAEWRKQTASLLNDSWAQHSVMPSTFPQRPSGFWAWLMGLAQQTRANIVCDFDVLQSFWYDTNIAYAQAFSQGARWLAYEESGIVVFHNPFAFWGRLAAFPSAAYLELARQIKTETASLSEEESRELGIPSRELMAVPLDAWQAYVRRVPPSLQKRWQLARECFKDLPVPCEIDSDSYGVAWLLTRLSPVRRSMILRQGGRIPVRDLLLTAQPRDWYLVLGWLSREFTEDESTARLFAQVGWLEWQVERVQEGTLKALSLTLYLFMPASTSLDSPEVECIGSGHICLIVPFMEHNFQEGVPEQSKKAR